MDEPNTVKPEHHRRRGIFLLPNLFTTGALFAGFYAIVAALHGHYAAASIVIFFAMILDSLDGRIARMTNTQTAFGAEYDSLSDMVAFGLAPALLAYSWSFQSLGKYGWLTAFVYVATTALRLARFNTQVSVSDKRYFQGLPSPSAAAVVTSMVWVGHEFYFPRAEWVAIISAIVTLIVGFLMVSRVRYYSFKELEMRGKVSFITVLIVVVLFVAIALDPAQFLFYAFSLYALSGPVLTLWQLRKRRKRRRTEKENHGSNNHL